MASPEDLEALRQRIDKADMALMKSLARRWQAVGRVALVKSELGIEPEQPERYEEMMRARHEIAEELHLSHELVDSIFEAIHHESLRLQESRRGNGPLPLFDEQGRPTYREAA